MISENCFGLPDSEMRLWALISTLNFLFPNSWLRQRTTALLLYETDHFSIGGDDEEDDEDHDEFQLPVSPNLQSKSSLSVFVAGWRTRENLLLRFPLLLSKEGGILHATAPPSGWSLRWVWRWRTRPSLLLLFGDAEEKDTLQVHSVYLLKNYSKLKDLLLIQVFTVAVSWFRKAFHFIFLKPQ